MITICMGKTQSRVIFLLAVVLACCGCALALDPSLEVTQYAHKSWKISEGFGRGDIWALDQTPDGYLWLATEFGLRRFDGVRTVEWQPPAGEHLPSNDIRSLIAARDGTLWIGTAKGLASWKAGTLAHYPEFDKHDVHSLLEDREGTVWAAGTIWAAGPSTPGKLCAISRGGVHCFGSDGRFGPFGVTALYEDSLDNLWLGAANGLWRWKPGSPKHFPVPQLEHYGVAGLVFPRRAFLEDDHGTLLITGPSGIRRFIDGKFSLYPLPYGAPQFKDGKLLRDRDGGLWIGTSDAGLLHIHQGKMDVFAQPDGLSSDVVQNLFEDHEGNIWIATNNGLDRFREYAVPSISVKQGLSTPFVTSVLAARDGSVWIGTFDGLNRWMDGKVTIYRNRTGDSLGTSSVVGGAKSHRKPDRGVHELTVRGLPDNYVGSLYEEPGGRIWISTARGVAYFENGKFTSLSGVHLREWSLSPVARDREGNLWMTSDQGLYRLSGGRVAEYWPSAKLGLRGALSTLLVTDPLRGGLWLGSWQGGVVYFKDGQVRGSYGPADGLPEASVDDLELDSENTLWAATEGGLSHIKSGHVATLTKKNGLPCDRVYSIAQDDAHSFWMYTACGLMRISRSELEAWVADPGRQIQATILDTSDGVKTHAGVLQYAPRITKAADGRVWFVPFDGVSVVDPRRLHVNEVPPPVVIEQITAEGKTYDPVRGLHLPPLIRDLTIDYTALSFVAPENVRFRYKLEGQDSNWREGVTDRRVQYSNLAPGNYRFRVTACNNSGVWNEEGAVLDFSVASAYWQTNWFRAACVAAILAMLWMLYRLRVGALERHQAEVRAFNEQLIKAQEAERMHISGELHDGVLQQITSLTLRLGKVKRQVPPDSEATATVNSLQQQLIQIGTDIRQISHELHPALLQESGLPAALAAYCEEFSKVRGLPVECEIRESLEQLSPVAALCLYRIAQEALGNAAKHSEAKRVEVRLTRSHGRVRLAVSDDGVGCEPNQIGKSKGLGVINMRERVLQLDGKFEFESAPGRGTTVKAEIPFQPAS